MTKLFKGITRRAWEWFPKVLKRLIYNALARARARYDLKIGAGSFVFRGNQFSRGNVIMDNSFIAYSSFGKYSYVANGARIVNTKVGAFCSIGDCVRTCVGMHPVERFSTSPQTYSLMPPSQKAWVDSTSVEEHKRIGESRYVVKIGNDVWVGNNVTILDGVSIGDGAVIAAGAIVTKDVDPYAIVGGVPAKLIRYRFNESVRAELIQSDWWAKSDDWIIENVDALDAKCIGEFQP